jgi:hypothetical protein
MRYPVAENGEMGDKRRARDCSKLGNAFRIPHWGYENTLFLRIVPHSGLVESVCPGLAPHG